ncbi:MAG: DotU family type IV/VI secretion system protein [Alphaproteobacteria bacterium]|nr:MAG: DotU family type IV/VI secretion system protein [Alphaproteobacteria bacterium]
MNKQLKNAETSFVIRFFEEFVAKVAYYKKLIDQQAWIPSEDYPGPCAASMAVVTARNLKETLDRQALEAPRFGGEFASQFYREAQFIMAAYADEVFIHHVWAGQKTWEKNLLENQVFGSHTAGEKFFTNLDDFLQKRDAMRADIGYLYLMALGLGFLGRFRGHDNLMDLHHYRRQLYVFIHHEEPEIENVKKPLFVSAYVNTLEGGESKSLHNFRPWIVVFFVMVLTLLLASYQIWHHNTRPLLVKSDDIVRLHEALKGRSP